MPTIEKRGPGRPPKVKNDMLGKLKSVEIGQWAEMGVFSGQTAAQREKILREAQGNIETEVVLRARRVRGRASRSKRHATA